MTFNWLLQNEKQEQKEEQWTKQDDGGGEEENIKIWTKKWTRIVYLFIIITFFVSFFFK